MSEKNRNGHNRNNTDSQNTKTTYIPPEVRAQYRQQYRQPYPPQQQGQYGGQQPYPPQQQGQYGGQQPYPPQQQGQYGGQPPYPPLQQGQYGAQPPYPPQQQGQYGSQQPYPPHQQGQYGGQQPSPPQQQGQYGGQQPYPPQQQGQYGGQQPYQPQLRRKRQRNVKDQTVNRKPQQAHRKKSPEPRIPTQPKKKKRSGIGALIRRVILVLLIIFLLLFGAYSCVSISLIKKMNYQPTGSRDRTSNTLSRSYVTNVLLIGTDGRTLDERGRSDTMILVSLNSATNEICVTSFMRDCYVEVPGYGWDKLNAAYSYGGAELLMDTIEHNFGVRIDDYVSINFISFAKIVDAVGGIDVDLTDAEAREINVILQAEVNEIMGDGIYDDLLSGGGTNIHLSGKQALSYARIRYVGNADFERTERQRKVVELVMDKMKTLNPVTLQNISSSVMPNVTTNMTTSKLYLLSLRAPFLLTYERSQLQIPVDGSYYGQSTPSGDALIVDFDTNYNALRSNVFSKD